MEQGDKIPKWMEAALQGITYWIGHRRCIWPHHPLPEAAFVAEICNLISAHLPPNFRLRCEVSYRELLDGHKLKCAEERARADLVVFQVGEPDELVPKFVIEVKRAGATSPKNEIAKDLARLAEAQSRIKDVRAFLFAISEGGHAVDFVNADGTAFLGRHEIKDYEGKFQVRRVLRAASSQNIENAHYACAVEVFG